jgi:predicted MPP superfamily phosphohydrolase
MNVPSAAVTIPAVADRAGSAPGRMTRRAFLRRVWMGGATTIVTGMGAGAYAHFVEPFWATVVPVEMDIPDLPDAWVGRRIVQLSDLHFSRCVPAEYLQAQIRRCNELAPDIVLLTGDYITAGDFRWSAGVAKILGGLRPRQGTIAVLGNHDYGVYSPFRQPRGPAIGDHMQRAMADVGVTVLRNEAVVLEQDGGAKLQFVGLEDLWSGLCDADQAFARADSSLPTIALTHNPDTLPLLGEYRADWLLCGHTHGGQVRVPLFGALILPVQNRQLDAGRIDAGRRTVYINRGLGSLHQIRFNCRPEITLFTLARRA